MPSGQPKNLIQNKYKEIQEKFPEEVAKAIHNTMIFAGDFHAKPKKLETAEEIADALNAFFKKCEETQQLPTIEKMYLALGIDRKIAHNWETRGEKTPEVVEMIRKAKEIIASMDAELATSGTTQPIIYIFRAKNYYGMRDQVDIQATNDQPLGEKRQILEEKYKNSIDAEIEHKAITHEEETKEG